MPHPMFADDLLEIIESFVVETKEIFERLDNDLLALEQRPDDKELLNGIFRAVHTVKGTSGFLSFDQMSILAHQFEDVLNKLRRGDLAFQPGMMDVMLAAFDRMKALLRQVEDRQLENLDLDEILAQLKALARGDGPEVSPGAAPEIRDAAPAEAAPLPARADRAADTTIRVDVARLDHLMDLVGELVLGRNRLAQVVTGLEHGAGGSARQALADAAAQIDYLTMELQSAVMKTRMVPIGRLFSRFPRVVRDVAKELGKQVDFVVDGEETELDKSVVEEITDPLVHLIRNAADHGIEPADERRKRGKPEAGRIRLAALQEGNRVVIEIEDDGAGIDPERVCQKAVEKGLLRPEEAERLSRTEAYNLIFLPGFSTAQQISSISGRGVGMDVVMTHVARLNGTISIESEVGVGTRFVIRLPLTLAIIHGLLVCAGDETFALPLHSVAEVVRISRADILTVNGAEVIRLRDRVLPLVRVGDVLGVARTGSAEADRFYVVVVTCGHQTFGSVVDDLMGQTEVVIKPLGNYLKAVPAVAGSTILGDGRVVMILDPAQLAELAHDAGEPSGHYALSATSNGQLP